MTATGRFAHKHRTAAGGDRLWRMCGHDVCRGCTCLWAGVGVGAVVAATGVAGMLAGSVLLAFGLAGLRPGFYAALPDAGRDLARLSLGAAPATLFAGGLRAGLWYPAAVILWFAAVDVLRAKRARRRRVS